VTSTRRLIGAAALLLAVPAASSAGQLAESAAAAAPVRTAAVHGADGIGDPYFPLDGNGGIDVLRYRIHDGYWFGDQRLTGHTRITLRTTQALKSFDLDFLLPVTKVTVDGRPALYDQAGHRHELVVQPKRPLAAGRTFEVRVTYAGFPARYGYRGERNWLADRHEVVAMNQPHMAPWWFPANDHPQDKARVDISITVPRERTVVANGRLLSNRRHGDRRTFHWRADEPMVPYLAFFAAGEFAVAKGVHDGMPWLVAASKRLPTSLERESLRMLRKTPVVVAWLETQLGPYPFSVTGGLVTSLSPGFALENQTRPTYPFLGAGATGLLVHELAHQWFGDSVAVHEWRDIWLNEGFATFMEVRYDETHGGPDGQDWLQSTWDGFSSDGFWKLPIGDPGAADIFAPQVYTRGAMTLQALRHRVGEAAFWTILRTWTDVHAGGNASTEDFVALAEAGSGQDLDAFFDTWLMAPTRPEHTAANGF